MRKALLLPAILVALTIWLGMWLVAGLVVTVMFGGPGNEGRRLK